MGIAIVTFTVTLSAASGRNVTVSYATADGTATRRPTTRNPTTTSRSTRRDDQELRRQINPDSLTS